MRLIALAVLVTITACGPSAAAPASATPTVVATTQATMTALPQPSIAADPTPDPTAAPAPGPPDSSLAPKVSVTPGVFAIMTTLRTKLAVVDDSVIGSARWGVQRYLESIDAYRNGASPALPITGPFLAAVSTALKDSATPGVTRRFEIESLAVDHHVQKPWGTHAYVDVTVTLVDRAVGGNAADQRETGKLRLTGDKLFVTDGWDYEHGRWFNGFGPLPLEQVRVGVAEAVSQYLWLETWIPNTTPAGASNGTGTPFQSARATRVRAIDRRQVASQQFENVTATIERFETIDGVWSGIATVRVSGTGVRTNASATTDRLPVERGVRVFVLGNWIPEVIDEQLPQRDWASGGDLALDRIDHNWA